METLDDWIAPLIPPIVASCAADASRRGAGDKQINVAAVSWLIECTWQRAQNFGLYTHV